MRVFNLLNEEQVEKINEAVETTQWQDGKATAMGAAKDIKQNFQITNNDPIFKKEILPILATAMFSGGIKNYTFIKNLVSPRLASYYDGGHYDWHVDVAIMDRLRTDLSFSVFLRDASEYEGGEMEMEIMAGKKAKFKGKKGQVIVYPSGLLHKVNPVTSGERRVIVGWINSNIKLHEHRERLFEFNTQLGILRKELGSKKTEVINRLYHQMVRDYSE